MIKKNHSNYFKDYISKMYFDIMNKGLFDKNVYSYKKTLVDNYNNFYVMHYENKDNGCLLTKNDFKNLNKLFSSQPKKYKYLKYIKKYLPLKIEERILLKQPDIDFIKYKPFLRRRTLFSCRQSINIIKKDQQIIITVMKITENITGHGRQ